MVDERSHQASDPGGGSVEGTGLTLEEKSRLRKRQKWLLGVVVVLTAAFGAERYRAHQERLERSRELTCEQARHDAVQAWSRYLFRVTLHLWKITPADQLEQQQKNVADVESWRVPEPAALTIAKLEELRGIIGKAPSEVEAPNVDELVASLRDCPSR